MLWSILIPTIPERADLLSKLVAELEHQIGTKPVEVLTFLDNKKRSIGRKRNSLIKSAKGKYISFVDDDDWVSSNYVSRIIEAIENNHEDVISFTEIREGSGIERMMTVHSLDAGDGSMTVAEPYYGERSYWTGLPSHLCVWRRSLAKKVKFENKSWGEDFGWMKKMADIAKTHFVIEEHLYTYRMGYRVK